MIQNRKISPPLEELETLRQPMTEGERLVFDLFNKHLPLDWEIYIQPHLNGLRPDFVLLSPLRGIAVFEVKDWDLNAMMYFTKGDESEEDESNNKKITNHELWAKKDGKEFCIQSQNPIPKVNLYKKEIFDLYCPRIQAEKGKMGFAGITAGVIFPFAKKETAQQLLSHFLKRTPSQYWQYSPISGNEDILGENIRAIFPEFDRENSRLIKEEWVKDLRGWLDEPDFAKTQREPLKLDSKQTDFAKNPPPSGYRRIRGPAGSGKSLVLAACAARLASEGKSVLVVTYNITLWHYLRDLIVRDLRNIWGPNTRIKKYLDNICFTNFHLWCKYVCYDAGLGNDYKKLVKHKGILNSQEQKEEFFNNELPLLAQKAIKDKNTIKYDAILVDEGQDYQPLWWNILREVCKLDSERLLVADATQDIYGTAKAWTDEVMTGAGFSGKWAELETSYRLPPKIIDLAQRFANKYLPPDSVDLPQPEQGSLDLYPCHLLWVQCKPSEAAGICAKEAISLMQKTGKDGLANADVSIITQTVESGRKIVEHLEKDKIKVIHTFDNDVKIQRSQKMAFYMGDARIKATTLHSFKGWECPILLLHITDAKDAQNLAVIYAGLTRLKRRTEGSWLTVVCSAPELSKSNKA